MTDKQIMIDGVDVSGCISFDKNNEYNICCYDDIREDKIPFANFCVENKNCYFKQLARKTQECEKLKSQVDEDYNYYTTELKTLRDIISNKEKRNAALFLTSGRYRKALDEIEELKRDLQRGFDSFLKQKEELFKEIKCYRKALEEIEKQCKCYGRSKYTQEFDREYGGELDTNILDIIDKLKE